MDELGLFTAALGLCGPWRVTRTEFDAEATQLDLYLGCDRGARFGCPAKDCAHGGCPVHDTVEKTWRHLDFFQHRALLHARLPRVRCPEHGAGAGQRALGASGVGIHAVVSRRWCLALRR
ncbi:MAG TPA: transposase family protein [Pseudonocardiaceae bacterium]|nr:transposase family protein [Pseudonocardiaceae bacterium]